MLLQEAVAEHPRRGTPGTELTKATSDGDSCDRHGSIPKALARRSNTFANLIPRLCSSLSSWYLFGILWTPLRPCQANTSSTSVRTRCETPLLLRGTAGLDAAGCPASFIIIRLCTSVLSNIAIVMQALSGKWLQGCIHNTWLCCMPQHMVNARN